MNTGEYKDAFLTEAREYLSTLNNALVQLENDPLQGESIKEIFRAAHTLKGMSATMGYEPMARLTHQMESVLDPVRTGKQKLNPPLMDALFACLDQLEDWVKTLTEKDSIPEKGLAPLLKRLEEAAQAETSAKAKKSADKPAPALPQEEVSFEFSESENEVLSRAKMSGFAVLRVTVELTEDCAFKEVRTFMALKTVNDMGEVVKSSPSHEEIEKGHFPNRFHLVVVTDRPAEELNKELSKITEVKQVTVEPFRSARPAPKAEAPAPAKPPVAQPGTAGESKQFAVSTVRVQTSKLDRLMGLAQELVTVKIRFEQVVAAIGSREMAVPLSQLHLITEELQDQVMKVRLMPVKQIFDRFPRMARDLAKELGKEVSLEMEGADVELDRTIIEEMGEPLVHLIRNALDHGLETPEERKKEGKFPSGVLRLEAKREKSHVLITVSDDGRGIDPDVVRKKCVSKGLISEEDASRLGDEEAIRLITLPGFSTRDAATELSGRGVGVDVAKTKVESLGGSLRIQSQKGRGSIFTLKFPLTLAILKVLLVRCGGQTFAIPVINIVETLDIFPGDRKKVQQRETILLRDEVVPLYRLAELLEMETPQRFGEALPVETALIAEVGDSRVGLLVDDILGQQEVALKSLDKTLKGIRGYAGATILGSGKISLILDLGGLMEDAKERHQQAEHAHKA